MRLKLIKLTGLLLLVGTLFVIAPEPIIPTVEADFKCAQRCDNERDLCWYTAVGRYVNCGQNTDKTEEECLQIRTRAYQDCMAGKGCRGCFDGVKGIGWYCDCGKPYSTNKGGGSIIAPYTYDPTDYDNYGWLCEESPEICWPELPW